ncbi:hypothetical protein AKO1_006621 [Acrasis kona]|uniref:Uncharacterized protein n=1 Tax=Acrasis kona TaxID=1008807 RepID=A0AAW2ZB28_9EUKA
MKDKMTEPKVDEGVVKTKIAEDVAKTIEELKDPYFVSRGAIKIQMKVLYAQFGAMLVRHNIPVSRSSLALVDEVIESTTDKIRKQRVKDEVDDEETSGTN